MNISFVKLSRVLSATFALALIILGGSSAMTAFAGGGGGGTTTTNPLPQTPPAPDILMRDSFGQGPELLRPASGKGTLKSTATGGTSINGFWLEYPGNKNNRWITTDSGETWRFCGVNVNPYELPSPLEVWPEQNTVLCNHLNVTLLDIPRATALIPMAPAGSSPYEVGVDAHYGYGGVNTHIALGLTNSAVTTSNLKTSGAIVLVIRPADANSAFIQYELRLGGFNGTLLTTGVVEDDDNFIRLRLRYNPQTRMIGGSIKGMDIGNFPTTIAAPRYAGFEGLGYVDNFTVTQK